jgi:hypothetical protein
MVYDTKSIIRASIEIMTFRWYENKIDQLKILANAVTIKVTSAPNWYQINPATGEHSEKL